MIGILTTVLLQSSTTVVAVVVSLEEAKAMSVQAGIFTVCEWTWAIWFNTTKNLFQY